MFVFLFRFTHNALRIFNVGPRGPGKHEYWHAAVAGAVSGLSVFAERPARRITYGQQLFVRGLQGWYNMLHARGLVHIPNGDVLLFGAACGQIMMAWLSIPESLPSGYRRWIVSLPVSDRLSFTDQCEPRTAAGPAVGSGASVRQGRAV